MKELGSGKKMRRKQEGRKKENRRERGKENNHRKKICKVHANKTSIF